MKNTHTPICILEQLQLLQPHVATSGKENVCEDPHLTEMQSVLGESASKI